jgi:tetratricopeptide (TPR) repeat protein
LGLPAEQEAGYLKAAIAADPNYYFAYSQHLNYLTPKWHGTQRKMIDFARQCGANPPDHSRIHFILLDAHWELAADYNEGSAHWNAAGVWEDVDRVFQTELKWRNTPKAHNEYAYYANICGQSAVLKRELEIIGYDMRRDVWKTVDPWIYARATVFPEYQGTRGKAGQYRWLIDQMNMLIPKAPNGGPYYMRGVAYRFFKDYAAAEADLKAALERSPYHTACLMELAQLYEKDLNQPQKAASYYLRLQQADPTNNSIYVPLIDFLTEQRQTTDCLRVSRDYFRLHPEYAQSRVYCAGAEARAKNTDRALAILNEAIYIPAAQLEGQSNLSAEHETQACLYATRGYVYYLAGNYVNALRDTKTAAAGVEDFMQGNYVMMRIYLGIGGPALMNPPEALKCATLRRTQLVHPDGDDYYWLGLAYAINNQTADARELYESGLKATPGHTSCTLGLQALNLPPGQPGAGQKPTPPQTQ